MVNTTDVTPVEGPAAVWRRWVEQARKSGEGDVYTGKRREARYPWPVPLEIRVPVPGSESGAPRTFHAVGHDICNHGLSFHCRNPIEIFSTIEIVAEGETVAVPGRVQHCTQSLPRFLIGVAPLNDGDAV